MAYTKYSLTPANNNAAPPDGAPEGMLPSAVNDTMRDMMAQIRDCGDGIRGGTYTMTAPVITGGSISGTTFSSASATITGGSINNTPIGASTANTGAFTTLSASSTVSGTGFSNYFASPPALGGTAAAAVSSTNLSYTGTLTGGTGVVNLGSGQFYKDANGNVGIGTSSPVTNLQVTSADDTYVMSQTTGTTAGKNAAFALNTPSQQWNIQSGYDSSYGFRIYDVTAGAERFKINTTGNAFFGNTIGTGKVNIQNASEGQLHLFYDTTYSWRQGTTNTGSYVIYRNVDSQGVYLAWGGTSWSANSDERLKTDLKPIENAINKVSSLRTVTGRYKTDSEDTSRVFLIAQDVQAVLPEAVNVQDNEQKTLGLQYTDVIPLLTAAIKELKAELDSVKAELATLKA